MKAFKVKFGSGPCVGKLFSLGFCLPAYLHPQVFVQMSLSQALPGHRLNMTMALCRAHLHLLFIFSFSCSTYGLLTCYIVYRLSDSLLLSPVRMHSLLGQSVVFCLCQVFHLWYVFFTGLSFSPSSSL